MHLLGYGFDPHDPDLGGLLQKQQESRARRNPGILEKLEKLGIRANMAEIAAETGKDEFARPHIAAHLVRKGYAASIDDAFDRYLSRGQPAYVDRYRISAQQAIAHIRQSGGIAVLAHPGLLPFAPGNALEKLLASLVDMGLGGMEVYYSGHSPEQTGTLKSLARRYGLLLTGGSDFHGDVNPEIRMGSGPGSLHVPHELFVRLCGSLQRPVTTR
jgi:predicted metal-dependent phosphoesterase TrpH